MRDTNTPDVDISNILRGLMKQAPEEQPPQQPEAGQAASAMPRPAPAPLRRRGRRGRNQELQERLPVRMPTTTVHQGRMPLYAPVRRPRHKETREFHTPWGSGIVEGILGQAHADLMECLWFCAENITKTSDGRVSFIVDPYRVRKLMSDSEYGYNTLLRLLKDLMSAVVTIIVPVRGMRSEMGHLIDWVGESDISVHNPRGGKRRLWRVELGKTGTKFLLQDLPRNRDPLTKSGMRHAVSKAVARHVLSHRTEPRGGWKIDALLDAVGVTGEAKRDKRRRLREDAEELERLGITIEGDRLRRGT